MEDNIKAVFDAQRSAFLSSPPPDIRIRQADLRALSSMVKKNEAAIVAAVKADFGCRAPQETAFIEVLGSLATIKHVSHHLKKWMKPQKRSTSLWFHPGSNSVVCQPRGVVGIMSPWNFPVHLTLAPLVEALAAGNRVMLKMSEFTPNTSGLLARLLAEYFPPERVSVIEGGPDVARAFAALPFDHLLYTGSTRIGRDVMRAAAENLTSVTLELGGKSPAVVDEGFSIAEAARRIAYGKMCNAGQICIAPDYALVPAGKEDEFCREVERAATAMYPTLARNEQYTSIISETHYTRLESLVDDARAKGARVVRIIPSPREDLPAHRKFPLTLILGVTETMRVAEEEIFGPILPVYSHHGIDDAISFVNSRPRPLALYVFSHSRQRIRAVLQRTVSGGVTVNDVLMHYLQHDLPFGGVGPSGLGSYHSREGFEAFSHKKAVFRQRGVGGFTGAKLLYPPFGWITDFMIRLMKP